MGKRVARNETFNKYASGVSSGYYFLHCILIKLMACSVDIHEKAIIGQLLNLQPPPSRTQFCQALYDVVYVCYFAKHL